MKYIFLLLTLFSLNLSGAQRQESVKQANIVWSEGFSLNLNEKGFKSSEGLSVFGSFSLNNERFRSIDMWEHIKFSMHDIILARKDFTIYILDLRKEKKIGEFKVPSRGTPRFIKVEPNENGTTNLRVMFRILPKAEPIKKPQTIDKNSTKEDKYKRPVVRRRVGRPGPLINEIFVYKDGLYSLKKRESLD